VRGEKLVEAELAKRPAAAPAAELEKVKRRVRSGSCWTANELAAAPLASEYECLR